MTTVGNRFGGTFLLPSCWLWIWQDVLYSLSVQTIPYSEFKLRLTAGDVVVCEVRETEIIGRIRKPEFRTIDPQTADSDSTLDDAGVDGAEGVTDDTESGAGSIDSVRIVDR